VSINYVDRNQRDNQLTAQGPSIQVLQSAAIDIENIFARIDNILQHVQIVNGFQQCASPLCSGAPLRLIIVRVHLLL